jgi:hypothetical protein
MEKLRLGEQQGSRRSVAAQTVVLSVVVVAPSS